MKRTFYRKGKRLRFEQLESRQLLAGDVTVSVVSGQLFITGDVGDNDIVISATANPGVFTVASGTASPTTINAGAGPVTMAGVTGDVFIDLWDGNDRLTLDTNPASFYFAGDIVFDLGADSDWLDTIGPNILSTARSIEVLGGNGSNYIDLDNLYVGGNVLVTLGSDNDSLFLEMGSIAGNLTVDCGSGVDLILVLLSVSGNVSLAGAGADTFWLGQPSNPVDFGALDVALDGGNLDLRNASLAGDLTVTGSGDVTVGYSDVYGHVDIALTTGPSTVMVNSGFGGFYQFGGNLVIDLGATGGEVDIEGANVANDLVIRTGDGADQVSVANTRAGNSLLIETGAGDDGVQIDTASADGEAAVLTGSGGDYVLVNNFLAAHSVYVDAAAGYDLISFRYCAAGHTVSVASGDDGDQVTVSVTSGRNLWLDSAGGYDAVRIEFSAFDTLYAQLGADTDSLDLRATLVRVAAALDGGTGYDFLSWTANLLTGVHRQNFESTSP